MKDFMIMHNFYIKNKVMHHSRHSLLITILISISKQIALTTRILVAILVTLAILERFDSSSPGLLNTYTYLFNIREGSQNPPDETQEYASVKYAVHAQQKFGKLSATFISASMAAF